MNPFSGILIFLSLLTSLVSYFINNDLFVISGILAWLAFLLLFSSLKNKMMIMILLGLSGINFSFAYYQDFNIDIARTFTVNQYLLSLLIAVGFLRLIATPKAQKVKKLPRGQNSFFKTYLGIHLFGSVINLSSLILVADKMAKKAPLSNLQIVVLTRAFSSDAYWSPFFVAFAAVLTYVPNLNAKTILFNGLALAVIAFVVTYVEVKKKFDINSFQGYPIHFETLYVPVLLATSVLVSNYFYPDLKVIVLISFFSLVLTFFILPLKKESMKCMEKLSRHITIELPQMKMELSLFLVAGMFGVSISSLLIGYEISVPLENFAAFEASLLLLIFIILAFVGIHPIISIAIIGDLLSQFNHTLLAITFLMTWSTTVSTSPFSGLNLTIQSRYDIQAKEIFRLNIPYAIKMYVVCVIILHFLETFLAI